MKTIFKLLIAGIIVNAAVRGGSAAWNYYELKDAASQLITFGVQSRPSVLRVDLLKRASQLNLPVRPEHVSVERQGVRTTAAASYTQQVELFPNYPYPFEFSFAVEAYSLNPGVQE